MSGEKRSQNRESTIDWWLRVDSRCFQVSHEQKAEQQRDADEEENEHEQNAERALRGDERAARRALQAPERVVTGARRSKDGCSA